MIVLKIITLIENDLGSRKDLYNEHGISMYIEVDGKKILFDTGQSGKFIDNAAKLDVDLKDLDYVIISHGHYDHSGGFERLIREINPKIKLFVGKGFFDEKYSLRNNSKYEYTGNLFDKEFLTENNIDVEYIENDITKITKNLSIFTNFNRDKKFLNSNQTMFLKDKNSFVVDQFYDEISLGISTDNGLVVVVGCSHAGIANIVNTIYNRSNENIYAILGGTHLIKEDDEKINRIIDDFKEKDVQLIGACHCTGKQAETMFYQQMEKQFINNNTGDILEL